MNKFISTLLLLFTLQTVYGQYQIGLIPRVSPDKAVYQKVGYTEIEIKYGSPSVNGRKLWGALVPYDKVWRAGANNATTIEFSTEVTIEGLTLDSGKYSFFVIPKEKGKWTVIFNKTHKQWGAFKYDESEDALRVDVMARKTNFGSDNLIYSIDQINYQQGNIRLQWDSLAIVMPFKTNYLKKFEQEVETRAGKQEEYIKWVVYVQGADHLLQIGSKQELAMSWINLAEKTMDATFKWNEQFYPRDYIKGHLYWVKAQLLAYNQDYTKADAYVNKLKSLDNTIFYDRKNLKEGIDTALNSWKEK